MKKRIKLLYPLIFLFVLLVACRDHTLDNNIQSGVRGEVVDEQEVIKVREVLENNLYYSNEKDIDGYLSTIVSIGHEETREVIEPFFEENDIHHELLEFEVVSHENEKISAKSRQKTINKNPEANEDEMIYRNHIAEVLLEFTQEDDEWKIVSSSISDVEFID